MAGKTDRRVVLEVSLGALRRNYARISEATAPSLVISVLKANAYGLGVRPIAETLAKAGTAAFGVAELNEAEELIDSGLPVLILGGVLPDEIPAAVEMGAVLPVTDPATAEAISRESRRRQTITTCHFLVDTGMGRLGILAKDAVEVITRAVNLPGLNCAGIYSHFPMAYAADNVVTRKQINYFIALLKTLESRDIAFDWRHIANSDAINNFPETCKPPFNCVRTGINLHGSFEMEGQRSLQLESVLTLKTKLVAVRRLPAGMTIGYGCTYTVPEDMPVGTVSAGYADGLPLALSNKGHVLVKGRPCPVLGRVSMDYTTVSLKNCPDAVPGDEVICLGGTGPDAISVEEWARTKGTHAYDIICSFGTRVERKYVE